MIVFATTAASEGIWCDTNARSIFGAVPLAAMTNMSIVATGARSPRILSDGFVPATPSPADTIELDGAYAPADLAAMPGDAAMLEEKRALLASCRYDSPRTFALASRRVDPAVVCALRLIFLGPSELADECAGSWNRPLLHRPVSMPNERRVATALPAPRGAVRRGSLRSLRLLASHASNDPGSRGCSTRW